jgi:hypothetical protein
MKPFLPPKYYFYYQLPKMHSLHLANCS